MITQPRQRLAWIVLLCAGLFGCAYVAYSLEAASLAGLSGPALAIVVAKTAVELLASVFGIAFLASAVVFLLMRERATPPVYAGAPSGPPVGIIYLCCDDADWSALESLTRLSYRGPLVLVIHDDSRDRAGQAAVDRMAGLLAASRDWDVRVLRRPERSGGKAGAVNYALEQTAHLYEFFLLCDNDSTVLDPAAIERALGYLQADGVGGVQFRSLPVADPSYCGVNRRLAASIAAFHAFLAPAARYGWMPFIGHNALLRTSAVRAVGGLTPGFFSDDLDLTVRLNLAGYRIAYAPEIEMGEKHPPSYTAFRKRSYKWAYGCVQTLRAHAWTVLRSPRFTLAEKLGFFQFAGFYSLQCILLAYLCFMLLVVPLGALGTFAPALVPGLIVGSVLVALVYAPLLSFYLKTPGMRGKGWVTTLALCGLVHGGTDFSVFRGVADAVRRRQRAWVPTNGVPATAVDAGLFAEAAFGVLLLAVPIGFLPELLYLPCWFLFAGKFLFGPALSVVYRDAPDAILADVARVGVGARHIALADAHHPAAFERAGA